MRGTMFRLSRSISGIGKTGMSAAVSDALKVGDLGISGPLRALDIRLCALPSAPPLFATLTEQASLFCLRR
jgi:hypothetical protein